MVNYHRFHIKLLMPLSSIYFVLMRFMRREVSISQNLHSLYSMIGIISSSHNHLLFLRTLQSRTLFRFLGRKILPFSTVFISSIRTLSFSNNYRFAEQPCKTSHKSNPSSVKPSTATKYKPTSVTLSLTHHQSISATQ